MRFIGTNIPSATDKELLKSPTSLLVIIELASLGSWVAVHVSALRRFLSCSVYRGWTRKFSSSMQNLVKFSWAKRDHFTFCRCQLLSNSIIMCSIAIKLVLSKHRLTFPYFFGSSRPVISPDENFLDNSWLAVGLEVSLPTIGMDGMNSKFNLNQFKPFRVISEYQLLALLLGFRKQILGLSRSRESLRWFLRSIGA